MTILNNTFLLRMAVAVILLVHSVITIAEGSVNDFGKYFLNASGFDPVGVPLAWAIKISHVLAALCLIFNRFIIPACISVIIVLIGGIIMVHWKEGWFVVGGGRNGVEFNFLLIAVLITILYQDGIKKRKTRSVTNTDATMPPQ
jgi:putative oxidoreductase